ncbi:MAG: SPOR domain-containing protein, partial [Geminicoccaceae bacterium]
QAKIRNQSLDIEATELRAPVMLELSAAASAKDAWATWHRLLQDDADGLQDLQPRVVEVADDTDDAAKSYSLRVGPFDRHERADDLCSRLKDKRADCSTIEAGG